MHKHFNHCRQNREGFPTEWFKITFDELASYMESQPFVIAHTHHEKGRRKHYKKDFYLNSRKKMDLQDIPNRNDVGDIEEALKNYSITDLEILRLYNIQSHVIPGAVKLIWDSYISAGKELQFWNIVREKTGRDIPSYINPALLYAEKYKVMRRLFETIGLTHSCETKTWSHEAFAALAPDILKLNDELRKVLGLRSRQGDKKESEFLQASDLLKQVLHVWSGSILEKKLKMKRRNRSRVYDVSIKPFHYSVWTLIIT